MFGKKKDEFAAEAPKPSFTGTHIAEGVEMRGDFTTTDPIIIDGTLIGDIESSNEVTINETGVMQGNGSMKFLDVKGKVDGELTVLGITKVASTGVVGGSLATIRFQPEDDSTFDGKLTLIKKPVE